jgi:hypothetical protein
MPSLETIIISPALFQPFAFRTIQMCDAGTNALLRLKHGCPFCSRIGEAVRVRKNRCVGETGRAKMRVSGFNSRSEFCPLSER